MAFETYTAHKRAFIFGLDDILYPEKDYLLQVYYLFSEFMEYTSQINAKRMIEFMQSEYAHHGSNHVFEKTAKEFAIEAKYESNFDLLHENARLPLKLLLFQGVLSFMQEIVADRKEIYLLISGKPLMQLNKIKQIEWHGLEDCLKVYFVEELESSLSEKSINFIIKEHQLHAQEVLFIGNNITEQTAATRANVEFLNVRKLL